MIKFQLKIIDKQKTYRRERLERFRDTIIIEYFYFLFSHYLAYKVNHL